MSDQTGHQAIRLRPRHTCSVSICRSLSLCTVYGCTFYPDEYHMILNWDAISTASAYPSPICLISLCFHFSRCTKNRASEMLIRRGT
ncbi:hypothetical protein EV361DRAFT_256003 [Lentinula raphanica]|nr:hypothetical protein EV361DRAFT_256003 [Lentinula raphanica]